MWPPLCCLISIACIDIDIAIELLLSLNGGESMDCSRDVWIYGLVYHDCDA